MIRSRLSGACTHAHNVRPSFYSAHTYKKSSVCVFAKRQYLTWIGDPLFPILSGPLLEINCPCASCIFHHLPHQLPSNRAFILREDNINKPDSSVRHTDTYVNLWYQTEWWSSIFYTVYWINCSPTSDIWIFQHLCQFPYPCTCPWSWLFSFSCNMKQGWTSTWTWTSIWPQ